MIVRNGRREVSENTPAPWTPIHGHATQRGHAVVAGRIARPVSEDPRVARRREKLAEYQRNRTARLRGTS